MAGHAVGRGKKAARKWLFGFGKQRHVHHALTAAQHSAQSHHPQFVKVVQGGVAAARVPTGAKLFQRFFVDMKSPCNKLHARTNPYASGNRDPWLLWFRPIPSAIALGFVLALALRG